MWEKSILFRNQNWNAERLLLNYFLVWAFYSLAVQTWAKMSSKYSLSRNTINMKMSILILIPQISKSTLPKCFLHLVSASYSLDREIIWKPFRALQSITLSFQALTMANFQSNLRFWHATNWVIILPENAWIWWQWMLFCWNNAIFKWIDCPWWSANFDEMQPLGYHWEYTNIMNMVKSLWNQSTE